MYEESILIKNKSISYLFKILSKYNFIFINSLDENDYHPEVLLFIAPFCKFIVTNDVINYMKINLVNLKFYR